MGREWGLKFQVRAGGEEWVAGKLQNLGGIPGKKKKKKKSLGQIHPWDLSWFGNTGIKENLFGLTFP